MWEEFMAQLYTDKKIEKRDEKFNKTPTLHSGCVLFNTIH
jgi:hypothetical protein